MAGVIVCFDDLSRHRMGMIVMVGVDTQGGNLGFGKQRQIFWMFTHVARRAGAANMVIEADNAIGRRHHQMQIVAHHQNAAAKLAT